jgi:hypothetical protein
MPPQCTRLTFTTASSVVFRRCSLGLTPFI